MMYAALAALGILWFVCALGPIFNAMEAWSNRRYYRTDRLERAEREAEEALRDALRDPPPIERLPDPLLAEFSELEEEARKRLQRETWKRAARGEFRSKRRR